jgi:hypothetical protein
VTFASGSCGFVHFLFDVFFLRFRSSRAKSSRVGVSMPEVLHLAGAGRKDAGSHARVPHDEPRFSLFDKNSSIISPLS